MSVRETANPYAVQDAPPSRSGHCEVNGTRLYFESRGSGPGVLLIGAADEDAEFFRPIAEMVKGRTVVTYDRRGTLRSGREDWPTDGSALHADDAAALIEALEMPRASVFGASAGGIVALQLALRHPGVVERALIFEPGLFCHLPGGERLLREVYAQVDRHLESAPDDWVGAVETLGRAIAVHMAYDSGNFFAPPVDRQWYSERSALNAEALIRGDLAMTLERIDRSEIARSAVPIRFSHGTDSLQVFEEITKRLASIRGEHPDRIAGVGHGIYYSPQRIASYIQDRG